MMVFVSNKQSPSFSYKLPIVFYSEFQVVPRTTMEEFYSCQCHPMNGQQPIPPISGE
jgi:hypothetical protein